MYWYVLPTTTLKSVIDITLLNVWETAVIERESRAVAVLLFGRGGKCTRVKHSVCMSLVLEPDREAVEGAAASG